MSNITQVINTGAHMKTLKKGIHASDLDQLLSSTGPFTLFAPTDLAFDKLAPGIMLNLLEKENKTKLTDMMNQHVVAGKVNFSDLKDGEKIETLSGKQLLVEVKNGSVSIDGAAIQTHDMKATNGVIHALDTVLNN